MTNNNEMNVTDTLTNDYVFLNGADSTVTDAVLSATKIENNNAFTNYGTTNAGIVNNNAGGTMTNNNAMNVTDTLTNSYVFLNDATGVLTATKINIFKNFIIITQ